MSYYAPFYRPTYYAPNAPVQPPMDNGNMYYQQPMQQNVPQTAPPIAPQPQQMSNDMIWVQGLAGAKAYLVAPNTTVTLWDSERKTAYLKSCDGSGIPSLKILDYTERSETEEIPPTESVSTKSDNLPTLDSINALNGRFDDILSELNVVKSKINDITPKTTAKNNKKSEE